MCMRSLLWLTVVACCLLSTAVVEGLNLQGYLSRQRRYLSPAVAFQTPSLSQPFFAFAADESTSSSDDEKNTSVQEAEALRLRAKQLLAEAREMEEALANTQSRRMGASSKSQSSMFDRLFFNRPVTAEAVASVLREERWSVDQAVIVLEGLYQRHRRASPTTNLARQGFQIADTSNAAGLNETEFNVTNAYAQCLIQAAAILDAQSSNPSDKRDNSRWSGRAESTLRSRWNEMQRNDEKDLERRLMILGTNLAASAETNNNTTVNDYMRRTLGLPALTDDPRQFNLSRVMERVQLVPIWVPSSLLPFLIASRAQLQSNDIKAIKERVLSGTCFFCTSSDSIPSAAIFRGNIRADSDGGGGVVVDVDRNRTAIVFEDIQRRMDTEGLSERVQLFFLSDPEWRPGKDEREPKPRPVLLALSRIVEPDDSAMEKSSVTKKIFRSAAILLSIVFTFAYSVGCFALNPDFFNAVVNKYDAAALLACLPIFFGVAAIQAIHEFAHTIMGRRWGIKTGTPLPLPSSDLGTFGCIRPLRSFPPNRIALLDFALSGPVSAFLVSLVCMVCGALQTVRAPERALASFPFVPAAILKSSFLSGTILSCLAPKTMMMPLSQPIPISPLFLIGFAGLFSSALNLLPIFRLDGGRACTAALGSRFAGVASASTVLSLLSFATSSTSSGVFLGWLVIVVLFQRQPEIPVRDEVTEIDDFRLYSWIASLVAAVATIVPFPGGTGYL